MQKRRAMGSLNVAVLGGGVIGASTAVRLLEEFKDATVTIIEGLSISIPRTLDTSNNTF